jgi:hypothetical protein
MIEGGGGGGGGGEEEEEDMLLVGSPEEKRTLGRSRCRWVDNIKLDLGEIR